MNSVHILLGQAPVDDLSTWPYYARLLARSRPVRLTPDPGFSSALARQFGLDFTRLAAVLAASDGLDGTGPGWFFSDPVHLLAGMHSVTVFDRRQFSLSDEESLALTASLNAHFQGEVEFFAPTSLRWYARFALPPGTSPPPTDQIAGGPLEFERSNPDARQLTRVAMEIQMILHDHPVNRLREGRGAATINGIWFWGGAAYRQPDAHWTRVITEDHATRCLADAAGIATREPHDLADSEFIGATLIALPDPRSLDGLDQNLFKPVFNSLRTGRIDTVELHLPGHGGLRHSVNTWQAWAFWRN